MTDEFSFSDLLKQAEGQSGGFEPLPNGEYDVTVESSQAGKTGSGKPKITVRYKVEGGPHAGRLIFDDLVISAGNPQAMVIFFRKMSVMGLKNDYFSANPPLEHVAGSLAGKKLRVKVGQRTWQNVTRNSVLAHMPYTGAGSGSIPGLPPAPSFAPPTLPQPQPPSVTPPAPPAPPAVPAPPPVPEVPVPAPPAVSVLEPVAPVPPAPEPEPAEVPAPPVVSPAPSLPF